ncbi:MAG: helix-turn-helix transcriptional regulator [Candidatus Limnocylindrales bacterium]|jgi:DNA-binding PadR family transcriptional regulator
MDELSWNGLVTLESRIDRAIVGALRGQDLSGFEIWRWLGSEDGTLGLLAETDLYPTLYRLEAEHLLQSDWYEGERTRRKYRLTATALQRAEENGWPPLAFRGRPGPSSEPERTGRAVSPDPDSGSWFVPPKAEPVGTTPLPSAPPASATGSAAIDGYSNELGAALDLPRVELDRVRQEIADHLADSRSTLALGGLDEPAATSEVIDRLGNPRDLATRINLAQHTQDRRGRAVRRAVIELVAEMVLWLSLSVAVFVLAPGVCDVVIRLGRVAGLDLTVLRSAAWATNQMAIMVCLGAFAAGRLSMGHLARISRHRDATLRRRWAPAGAAAVLALALLLPGYQDGLVVATLLATPLAFVVGTYRPKHVNESSYTWRGVASAILVVAAVTLLPAERLFAYDPNATPGAPLAPGQAPGELTVYQQPDGTFDYEIPQPAGTGVVSVELWPASTDGLFIVVDRSATAPTISVRAGTPTSDATAAPAGAQAVDFGKLPPYPQWWVVAVTTGQNGSRTALDVVIQTGASPNPGTALGWLIAHL